MVDPRVDFSVQPMLACGRPDPVVSCPDQLSYIVSEPGMDLLKLFDQSSEVATFKAGETVFHAGDEAHHLYVVLDGELEIQLGGRVLERSGPGAIVGEMALINDHRRTASAIALTNVRLAPVDERRFLFLVRETPFFALYVMRALADRIRRRDPRPGSSEG